MRLYQCSFLMFAVLFLVMVQVAIAGGLEFEKPLMEQLELNDTVNIIVTIKPSLSMHAALSESLSDSQRMDVVLTLQNQVLNRLDKADYSHLKRFKFVPQFSMSVNRKGLESLMNEKNIEVHLNKIHYPSLMQSVPRVFPHHDISQYNGDNQWAVAVLDTGVDKNHSFLATGSIKKVISEACYSGGYDHPAVSSFCPGGSSSSTATGSALPCPSHIHGCGHGTHVAGIAVGDGSTFDGVAELGKLIAIKVFSRISGSQYCNGDAECLGAFDADIISGLERVYALRNTYKIASANMSLGGGAYSGYCDTDPLKPIIDLLKSAKIATVVASGNNGYSSLLSAPACISSAIAVGSTLDTADSRSYFSNNSLALDLYAPGSSITSSVPGGGFEEWDGTSMATPHVAGAWAVLRQAAPDASVAEIETVLKTHGPIVSHNGVSRRRIALDEALAVLAPKPDTVIAPVNFLLMR